MWARGLKAATRLVLDGALLLLERRLPRVWGTSTTRRVVVDPRGCAYLELIKVRPVGRGQLGLNPRLEPGLGLLKNGGVFREAW